MFGTWFRQSAPKPAVPEQIRVYAIGDIHGRSDLLERLMGMIRRDAASWTGAVTLVFIGDYIDRGRDSKGVIDLLLNDLPSEFEVHFLRGNHDQVMLEFLADSSNFRQWREFGGGETLLSYGVAPPASSDEGEIGRARDRLARVLPPAHEDFLHGLALSAEIGDYFFAHAGVKPGVALEEQNPRDLLWIRDEFLTATGEFGRVIVHGHTPTAAPVRRPNRIGIDTGAYLTGHLTAAVLEGTRCRFLQT